MILEENQLNIIINITSFFSAISLSLVGSIDDEECLNIGCEILNISLLLTNFWWLLSLMVTSYIILNKNENIKTHKICLIIFILANIITLIYMSLIGIYRIIHINITTGIMSLINILILIIVIMLIKYNN